MNENDYVSTYQAPPSQPAPGGNQPMTTPSWVPENGINNPNITPAPPIALPYTVPSASIDTATPSTGSGSSTGSTQLNTDDMAIFRDNMPMIGSVVEDARTNSTLNAGTIAPGYYSAPLQLLNFYNQLQTDLANAAENTTTGLDGIRKLVQNMINIYTTAGEDGNNDIAALSTGLQSPATQFGNLMTDINGPSGGGTSAAG